MKLGFVVQRYNETIAGGAEQHARMLAHQLKEFYSIEILTTCAAEYDSWKNAYPAGPQDDSGILIRRFEVDFERHKTNFDRLTLTLLQTPHSQLEEIEWLVHQGPYSGQLFQFLRDHQQDYDFLVFYTYLYITTVFGMMIAPDKSLLIPTAHDEPVSSFSIFNALFHLPRGLLFLTEAEKEFVHNRFRNEFKPSTILGSGISPFLPAKPGEFSRKYSLPGPFILYIGRVDEGKGCKMLIDLFLHYLEHESNSQITLVLAGTLYMPAMKHPQILLPGFLTEQDKQSALTDATLIVSPSRYESLSLLVLDAFNAGKPVLGFAESRVVTQHLAKSQAGFVYSTPDEFCQQLHLLLHDEQLRQTLGQKGKSYIDQNFRWPNVVHKFQTFLTNLS